MTLHNELQFSVCFVFDFLLYSMPYEYFDLQTKLMSE